RGSQHSQSGRKQTTLYCASTLARRSADRSAARRGGRSRRAADPAVPYATLDGDACTTNQTVGGIAGEGLSATRGAAGGAARHARQRQPDNAAAATALPGPSSATAPVAIEQQFGHRVVMAEGKRADTKLNVAVVGAGMGGLAAAACLLRA